MKKRITVICELILSIMISFFLPMRINAIEYPTEYNELLEEVRIAVESSRLRYISANDQQRTNTVEQMQLSAAARSFFLSSSFNFSSADLYALHYAVRDLDNNGTPELLLSYNKDELCAVFTVQNGSPVMIRDFMYRDAGFIYGQYLYNYGVGGAGYHSYHYCVLRGTEFTPIDGYDDIMGELYDINERPISRAKANEIDTKYKKLSTPEWHMVIPGVFADVDYSGWYSEPVFWASEKGVTSGSSEIEFSPNTNCDRAQMVTFLWRAKGCPEPTLTVNPFDDVQENAYYYKAVLWALENRITSGTSDTMFSPNTIITRAQTATFLWRMNSMPKIKSVNPFSDIKDSAYYYDAVLWAVNDNITKGMSSTSFSPNAACTRAQIVTFLYRALCPERHNLEVSNYFKTAERLQSALTMEKTEPWNLGGASFVKNGFYVETSKDMFSMKNEGNYEIRLYGLKLGNNKTAFYDTLMQNNWLPMDKAQIIGSILEL